MIKISISNPGRIYLLGILLVVVSGFFTYATRKVTKPIHKNKFEQPVNAVSPSLTRKARMVSPSVVELFTSEGCSSCPPADRLVAIAQDEFSDQAIVLTYHVDYWDKLGWKDSFSKNTFTQRQYEYSQHMKLESVYTPQAIVNGKTQFVGSDKQAMWKAINNNIVKGVNGLEIKASRSNHKQLIAEYNCEDLKANERVVVELVLKHAATQVKHGENNGATLRHINIVTDIVQNRENKGRVSFEVPRGFIREDYFVVAFVQNTETLEITRAKKASII